MPIDHNLYPPTWTQISDFIRHTRAANRCECVGECGLHQPNPEQRRCVELNHQPGKWMTGRVILTTAHLCDCFPLCAEPSHLKAMCQRCHLRVDRFRHAASRLRTQAAASYKARAYRAKGKSLGIENLQDIARLSKTKRRRPWTPQP